MSYAQPHQTATSRTTAILVAALIHALLGYALVTGLAYTVIEKATSDLKAFNVEEEPPPPPEEPPPPPPEPVAESPPPVVSPPPIVRTEVAPPPVARTVRTAAPSMITMTAPPVPPARPAPPPPPPPPLVETVPPRSAVGNLQGLFGAADYPAKAIHYNEQGSVTVRLTIGTNGSVNNCDVASSSGSRTLDTTTCRILERRASFDPARDNRGNPTVDTVLQSIKWVLKG